MAFATVEDIGKRYRRELTAEESASASMLLEMATAAITVAADRDDEWATNLDPVPKFLWALCIEVVARAYPNPESLAGFSEQIGTYQVSKRFKAGSEALNSDLMLTEMEEHFVRRVVYGRTSGSSRVGSLADDLIPTRGT